MTHARRLQQQLRHTWSVFFARHGNFTPIQQAALPPILSGDNTLLIAATAAGKTEAALAPLLERHVYNIDPMGEQATGLCILYICPTRALVRDLYERLRHPLDLLDVSLSMKSGDTGPVSTTKPPTVLITTPESTDSLLTRAPRLFTTLRAVVLDEIHLFDHSPRGDHLRCLLRRIETIRDYHQRQLNLTTPLLLQRVALSATVPDPTGVAQRYLCDRDKESTPTIVQTSGVRAVDALFFAMHGLGDLVRALDLRAGGGAGIRKSLVFCNTRNEVEQTAAYLREYLPYAAEVFVHYSNLDPTLRRDVEDGFAAAAVAICVSTSTLELGIDIGSIDEVVLIGPPPTITSFLQRIGRGGRRTNRTQVLCLARSALEEVRFQALLEVASGNHQWHEVPAKRSPSPQLLNPPVPTPPVPTPPVPNHRAQTYHFRLSVLVQQIFSLLKQSPTGGVRLADLQRMAPDPIEEPVCQQILASLTQLGYVQPGRLGEWRAGPTLDELLDAHEIYSNIGADPLAGLVVDAYTGRTLAQTERIKLQGDTLMLGGRLLEVVWRDRYKIGVRPVERGIAEEELRFQIAPFAVPLDVAQAVAAQVGLRTDQMALLHEARGAWLFHFWGDLYGEWLAALLNRYFDPRGEVALVTAHNEYCLFLPTSITQLPPWQGGEAQRQLRRLLPRIEPFLEVGRFHSLLPPVVADEMVIALCDAPRFEQLYRAAQIVTPSAALRVQLERLLG